MTFPFAKLDGVSKSREMVPGMWEIS
jgi:hypothetical protein